MRPQRIIWVIVALAVAAVIGWNLFRPAGGAGIRNVDAAGAQEAISQGAQVVDVRSEGEFQLGHIPGALNVPIDQFEAQAASWDRDRLYVVYCATGARSATAVDIMKRLGFTNVRHFAAGIQAWPGELQQGAATPSGIVPTAGKPVFLEFYTDS